MTSPVFPPSGEVHLWRLDHRAGGSGDEGLLPDSEVATMRKYRFERDRARYLFTQSAKRLILGSYLRQAPEGLFFHLSEKGKPTLAGLQFSISHTANLSVLAVSKEGVLGVDLETVRPQPDLARLARHIMTEAEWQRYQTLSDQDQLTAFYCFWTAKEAYLKNLGLGLEIEPAQVETEGLAPTAAQAEGLPRRELCQHPWGEGFCLHLASALPITGTEVFSFHPEHF